MSNGVENQSFDLLIFGFTEIIKVIMLIFIGLVSLFILLKSTKQE
jgi:hypothetical protein